jgi:hypothetical protein
MSFYEVMAVERVMASGSAPTFNEIDRIDPLDKIGFSKELNGDGFLSVSTRPERVSSDLAAYLKTPDEKPLELWLYRDGTKVFAGPLIGIQVQGSNNTMTFTARGILYYLRWMYLTSQLDYSAGLDQFTIVKNLVDHWQNKTYGNFGIDTSGIGTSGVTRDVLYEKEELWNIAYLVAQLSAPDDGFDFEVDPITRDLNLYYPQTGTDKSGTLIIDNRNLLMPTFFLDITAQDFATNALAVGTSFELTTPLYADKTNATRLAQFGRAGMAAAFDGVLAQTSVDNYAQGLVDLHSNFGITFGGQGGGSAGSGLAMVTIDEFGFDDVDPGDTVSFDYDAGFEVFSTTRDVKTINMSIDENGDEHMNLVLL